MLEANHDKITGLEKLKRNVNSIGKIKQALLIKEMEDSDEEKFSECGEDQEEVDDEAEGEEKEENEEEAVGKENEGINKEYDTIKIKANAYSIEKGI